MNRSLCMVAGMLAAAIVIAGCGGTSLNSNVARIRAYNGATPSSDTATIYINNGSANGDQTYEQVSKYLYINSGVSDFAWADDLLTGGSVTAFPATLNPGGVYTVILLGRADESFGPGSPILDITADDQTTPPSGDAKIRLIHDGPDAGPIDVYFNGTKVQSSYAYPGTTLVLTPAQLAAGTPFSTQTFSYTDVPAGTVSVEIKAAGTSTVLAGPTSYSVTSGDSYSIFFLEPTPTVTPITYTLQQISDAL